MKMNKKNIAIIGTGRWGTKIRRYAEEQFNVLYTADSKFPKGVIWDNNKIEGVIIATPIPTHYEIAKEALEAGKHIFVEKPVATTVNECKELWELARKKSLRIGVDYTFTFSKLIHTLKENVERTDKFTLVDLVNKRLGVFRGTDVKWVLASHELSILFTLFGMGCKIKPKLIKESVMMNGPNRTAMEFWVTLGDVRARIDVSMNLPDRKHYIRMYGPGHTIVADFCAAEDAFIDETTYDASKTKNGEVQYSSSLNSYDENNNLRYAMQYFSDLMDGKVMSNMGMATFITQVLEDL